MIFCPLGPTNFKNSWCKLKRFIDFANISIRTSRFFFFIRYEKNDQYNAAFEKDTQTKHSLWFRSCYFSQNNFLVQYFYFFCS
jgi:hypothetical protein